MPSENSNRIEPHGFTIFCEDIREGTKGTTTYVGVFGDAIMLEDELPFKMPKLCMAIHLYCSPNEEASNITIRIALPGEDEENPKLKLEVDLGKFELLDLPDIGDELTHPRAHIVANVLGGAFSIKKYGRIRVNALWDQKFVPLGSLAIAPQSSLQSENGVN